MKNEKISHHRGHREHREEKKSRFYKKETVLFLLTVHFLNPGDPVNPVNPDQDFLATDFTDVHG